MDPNTQKEEPGLKRQKHRQHLGRVHYAAAFPSDIHPDRRPNQDIALELLEKHDGRLTLEAPTGTGKTAVGIAFLRALEKKRQRPLFYIVPNKTQVQQVADMYGITPAFGRNEHLCLYYPDEELRADEIPCALLKDCPHRVDQQTGETFEPGATPCPYYQQKYVAKQSPIVVCTVAFYLFTQRFSREWDEPGGLVIDEAHSIADIIRGCLSYEITDYHLYRAIEILAGVDGDVAGQLKKFAARMIRIIKRKPAYKGTLLEDDEIVDLMERLEEIDADGLEVKIGRAIKSGKIDPRKDRETLKQIEVITRDLRRYLRSLRFSLAGKGHGALNYTYAYFEEEIPEGKRAQYRLVVKSYYVAPLIRNLLSPRTLAMSATIGPQEVFEYVTGIEAPAFALESDFPSDNTRLFMPTNTPNLAFKARKHGDLAKSLRMIAKACAEFKCSKIRCLVVVISNEERQKFLKAAEKEGLNVLTYGNGTPARAIAERFRDGEGDALVGTAAQYAQGVDLPGRIAGVTFMLRPGYPKPDDPGTLFEERRFSNGRIWAIRNAEVVKQALQVRGRNVRSVDDLGVTIFMSQQFGRFVSGSLPKWLKPAYRSEFTFDECVADALKLLG